MVVLQDASFDHFEQLVKMIQDFWLTHNDTITYEQAMEEWKQWRKHQFFEIVKDDEICGFLVLEQRGPIVAWIEAIYVTRKKRRQGIAKETLALAQKLLVSQGIHSICLDVVPYNKEAMDLYHSLGFDRFSLATLRKDFEPYQSKGEIVLHNRIYKI